MKRLFSIVCLLLVCSMIFPVNANAAENTENTIYFDDGSYMTIQIIENGARAASSKTGQKIYTYHATSDTILWEATLSAAFSYTGVSSQCTSAECVVVIYDTNWYEISNTTTKSANVASAELTIGRKVLGITISKETYNLSLTCDKDGNLS